MVDDFDGLPERLAELADQADGLADAIESVRDAWPKAPGMVTSAWGSASQTAAALRRGINRVHELEELARVKAGAIAAHAEERKYDAHTKAMAAQMGITPEAFLELQAERRKGMRGPAGTVTYSPDHEVIR